MVQKTNDQQLKDVASSNKSSAEQNNTNISQPVDIEMKRGRLSKESTLESIKEEANKDENSSLEEERLLLESFQSITDIFENEDKDVDNAESGVEVPHKSIGSGFSEDGDSLDEEVRRIMQGDEKRRESWNSFPEKKNTDRKNTMERMSIIATDEPESQLSADSDEEDSNQECVSSETESESDSESESESDEQTTETEAGNETDRSVNGWLVDEHQDDEDSEHSEDEFDLDKYLDKLCLQSTDTGSTDDESDDDSTYSDKKKILQKRMKKMSKSESIETDEDSFSESDNSEYEQENWMNDPDFSENEANKQEKGSDQESDDETSSMSSDSDGDFLFDEVDSASVSTDTSFNGDIDFSDHEDLDLDSSQHFADELQSAEPVNQPHDAVRKCYTGFDQKECPSKIDVHEGEIGRVPMDPTLSSPNVLSLRWPFTNYYVKEFDLEEKNPIYDDNDLLPSYKSMQASSSFPGRRRDVMQGRVWWVEWWANTASQIENKDIEEKSGGDESWTDIAQNDQFEPEMSHL